MYVGGAPLCTFPKNIGCGSGAWSRQRPLHSQANVFNTLGKLAWARTEMTLYMPHVVDTNKNAGISLLLDVDVGSRSGGSNLYFGGAISLFELVNGGLS